MATRRHVDVAEPVGAGIEARARSTSKSAVSRRFKAATEAKLAESPARDLSKLDVIALMVDGVFFAGHCIVVALASPVTARRRPGRQTLFAPIGGGL